MGAISEVDRHHQSAIPLTLCVGLYGALSSKTPNALDALVLREQVRLEYDA